MSFSNAESDIYMKQRLCWYIVHTVNLKILKAWAKYLRIVMAPSNSFLLIRIISLHVYVSTESLRFGYHH